MAAVAKYGWFKRMGDQEGGTHVVKWWQRPLNHRVFSSTWSSRRHATTTTVDITGKERRIRRRTWGKKVVDFIKDVLFRFVSVFETVFLVATLCFFYVRFGFQI